VTVRPSRGSAALLVAGFVCTASAPTPAPLAADCAAPAVAGARVALVAIACGDARGAAPGGAARLLFGLPLDLNRADAAALEALPGIGPGRAEAIVRARRAAPFCGVAELDRVPGLGAATRARLAPFVATPAPTGCADS
jgi:competence protein ComEA